MGNIAYLPPVTPPVDFGDLLRRWNDAMEVAGGAARTRATYRYEMTRFYADFVALDPRLRLDTLDGDDLTAYIVTLSPHGSKRNSAKAALKSFYGWAEGRIRPDDPSTELRLRRRRAPRAPDLTDWELHALLVAAFRHRPHWGWAILLAVATAARVSSLVAVRPEDVHDGRIWFRVAKADRPYEVPLSRTGLIAVRHLSAAGHETLLGVGAAAFRTWVDKAAQEAGITRKVHPHLLRHATLTRVARVTDPATVADIANWADLSQYRRYVAVDDDRKRAALDAVI